MNIAITETTYEHVRMMLHKLLDEWQILNEKLKAAKCLATIKDAEIERLKKEVSHTKEVEFPRRIEKVTAMIRAKLQAAESLASARLADQEAIERHTRKQIYRELYEIRYEPDKLLCKIERECAPYIQQKYGVE